MLIGSQSLLGGRELDIDTGYGQAARGRRLPNLRANSEGNVDPPARRRPEREPGATPRRIAGEPRRHRRRHEDGRAQPARPAARAGEAYENVNAGLRRRARSVARQGRPRRGQLSRRRSTLRRCTTRILHLHRRGSTPSHRRARRRTAIAPHAGLRRGARAKPVKSGMKGFPTAADRHRQAARGCSARLTSAESEATWNDLKTPAADARARSTADLRAGQGASAGCMSDPEVERSVVVDGHRQPRARWHYRRRGADSTTHAAAAA